MKRIILAVIVAVLAQQAFAQEVYSLPASAGQVTTLRSYVLSQNRERCLSFNLATNCTQSQACPAAGISSSCTAVQARTANVRIFPDTQAGREEYVTFQWIAPDFQQAVQATKLSDQRFFCHVWWPTASQANRDTVCSTAGLASGCDICP